LIPAPGADSLPVAKPQSYHTEQNKGVTRPAPGLLEGATNPDGSTDGLTAVRSDILSQRRGAGKWRVFLPAAARLHGHRHVQLLGPQRGRRRLGARDGDDNYRWVLQAASWFCPLCGLALACAIMFQNVALPHTSSARMHSPSQPPLLLTISFNTRNQPTAWHAQTPLCLRPRPAWWSPA
jgi:hypothetical protein